jgi:hypothetical protein
MDQWSKVGQTRLGPAEELKEMVRPLAAIDPSLAEPVEEILPRTFSRSVGLRFTSHKPLVTRHFSHSTRHTVSSRITRNSLKTKAGGLFYPSLSQQASQIAQLAPLKCVGRGLTSHESRVTRDNYV